MNNSHNKQLFPVPVARKRFSIIEKTLSYIILCVKRFSVREIKLKHSNIEERRRNVQNISYCERDLKVIASPVCACSLVRRGKPPSVERNLTSLYVWRRPLST